MWEKKAVKKKEAAVVEERGEEESLSAMICRIVQRAFIDKWSTVVGCREEKLNFRVRQAASVDSTLNEPLLSAKAY